MLPFPVSVALPPSGVGQDGGDTLSSSSGPHVSAHPKSRASSHAHSTSEGLLPARAFTANAVLSLPPAPFRAWVSGGPRSRGQGPRWGAQEVGGYSVTSHQCPLGGGPGRGEGVSGGYFSIFYFQIFFFFLYLNLCRFVLYKDSQ